MYHVCFLKENYGFHYSLLLPLALNLFVRIVLLIKVHNHPLSRCHIFTLFSHNRHDHVRIRVLVNTFSIRSSSLKKIFCCLSHSSFCFSKAKWKTIHVENEKPENEQPSDSLPLFHPHAMIVGHLPPPKTLWLNSRFLFQIWGFRFSSNSLSDIDWLFLYRLLKQISTFFNYIHEYRGFDKISRKLMVENSTLRRRFF